jgi:ATP-dependent Clp protease protease subunit
MPAHVHGHKLSAAALLIVPAILGGVARADTATKPVVAPPAAPAPPTAAAELRKVSEQLTLENGIAEAQLRKELAPLAAERQRRDLEASIARQKLEAELASRQTEIEKLNKQIDLINRRLSLKDAERKNRLDEEVAVAREKLERLRNANDIATAELAVRTRELALREQEVRLKTTELQLRKLDADAQVSRINTDIDVRDKRDQWHNRVLTDIPYTKEPFKNGVLTISDRRIALNGVVTMEMADRMTERVNFFNNQTREFPIFIVIDESPGGSVAAGYKILKTMRGSAAPVYVVVKSFAASMAAAITTLAARSFAYPNAIILHHQLAGGTLGNLTEHRERVKELEEWWRRAAQPIAAKMGITLDEFIKRMYQNRSSGDWREFADVAKKLKWVDEVAETIREDSFVKHPDTLEASSPPPRRIFFGATLPEATDANGKVYAKLPRLAPYDAYYLYNPDGYYRLTQ